MDELYYFIMYVISITIQFFPFFLFLTVYFLAPLCVLCFIFIVKHRNNQKAKLEQDQLNQARLEQLILQADSTERPAAKQFLVNEAQRMGYSQQAVEEIRKRMYERLKTENESK